eukprot:m.162273 g.162273  ORF g.162273 m.162273 type:complete len:667 (-) comp12170_c0_seq1:218-2218(-)
MSTTTDNVAHNRTISYAVAVDEVDGAEGHTLTDTNGASDGEKVNARAASDNADVNKEGGDGGHDDGAKHGDTSKGTTTVVNVPPETKKRTGFVELLRAVHIKVVSLDGYPTFLVVFIVMQLVRIAAQLGVVVVAFIIGDDFDVNDISDEQYGIFGGLGVLYVIGSILPFATKFVIDRLKESLQIAQASAVVAKIFEMQYDAMVTTPSGELIQLLSKVFRNLDTLLPALYGSVIPVAMETLVATVLIGALYGPICLILFGLWVAYTAFTFNAAGRAAQRNTELMTIMFSEWGKIMDTATAYERAHYFGNVDYEVNKAHQSFSNIGTRMCKITSQSHIDAIKMTVLSMCLAVMFILILPVLNVSVLELAALAMYFFLYTSGLTPYAGAMSDLRAAVTEYKSFDEYIGRRSEIADVPGAIELPKHDCPVIEFKNVSFSYGGKQILDDISFRVEGGETLGLVGSSGCGKSTILRLLLRFYHPTSGSIHVDGHDITQVTGESLRRLFSVMPQNAELFNLSIRDNIAYAKMDSTDDEIRQAAALAELPLGTGNDDNDLTLDKVCGEKGAKLSGGQQQRVALARAMLKNGTIYLLDEPTTALDGVVAQQLQKTLDKLCTHATTIYITHHLGDLKNASQILYVRDGKIIERGSFESLMAEGGSFAKQVDARKRE